MKTSLKFEKGKYKKASEDEMREDILSMGYIPLLISNTSGFEYAPHTHAESKLLAFVLGEMVVTVDGEVIECKSGDLLIIPGDVIHSATVGEHGCKFFWSEKLNK